MSTSTQPPATTAGAPLDHVLQVSSCLVVADLDRAVDWYGTVLDLAPESSLDIPARGERVAFLRRGPVGLELAERRGSAALRPAPPPADGVVPGPTPHAVRAGGG
ncbi:VOC family protein, partial [Streptomyces sp. NPDC059762]|uniref:VOC family protein n=1 Tax=Streptomyces sp. NPDC059762 TaxID=3346938 RepID=UPI00365F6F86